MDPGGAPDAARVLDPQQRAVAALRPSTLQIADEQKVEPVFTDLMGAHSKRMDAMGLAA